MHNWSGNHDNINPREYSDFGVITHDGKWHEIMNIQKSSKFDIAIITAKSKRKYPIAKIDQIDDIKSTGKKIIIGGYPARGNPKSAKYDKRCRYSFYKKNILQNFGGKPHSFYCDRISFNVVSLFIYRTATYFSPFYLTFAINDY